MADYLKIKDKGIEYYIADIREGINIYGLGRPDLMIYYGYKKEDMYDLSNISMSSVNTFVRKINLTKKELLKKWEKVNKKNYE